MTPVGIARPVDYPFVCCWARAVVQFEWEGGKPRDIGLVLRAEGIKDVVASTAHWLVIREVMGGVGRDNRKGGGWKLRG